MLPAKVRCKSIDIRGSFCSFHSSTPLQALVVLDFKLTIDNRTAVGVQLGRRGEAVSSTTRNHSFSELPMGGMEKRAAPSPKRDEQPYWVSEKPPQLREGLPGTYAVFLDTHVSLAPTHVCLSVRP